MRHVITASELLEATLALTAVVVATWVPLQNAHVGLLECSGRHRLGKVYKALPASGAGHALQEDHKIDTSADRSLRFI